MTLLYIPIVKIVLIVVIIAFAMWALNTYVPMQRGLKLVVNAFVVIMVILWLAQVLGLATYLG